MGDKYDFDLFVIGAGSGGVRASRVAADLGARVAIAEQRYLGGTCVNVGCIPKKLLVYASEFKQAFEDSTRFGWSIGQSRFDWRTLIRNKDSEIVRLNRVYEDLLINSGIKVFRERAQIANPNTIALGDERVSAKYILVATGGWPAIPPIPGAEFAITSNEAFALEQLPERIVIVGGGYISLEFAGIFQGFGTHVTIVHRGAHLLRGFDHDLSTALAAAIQNSGIDLHLAATVTTVERLADARYHVSLPGGAAIVADLIMFATGRKPNVKGLGLEHMGVALDTTGAVKVDRYSRTSVDHIYAIGDVTNRRNLTPVALAEGHAVAKTLFGNSATSVDYSNVPSAVFSNPPIATVGLTEAQARRQFAEIDIYKSYFRPLKYALTDRNQRSLLKLIVDGKTDRVVGCHMLGAEAAEIIQGFSVALKCGATKLQFDATFGIHPTSAEEFFTMREKMSE